MREAIAEVKARVADVVSHTNSTSANDEKAIAWVLAAVRDVAIAVLHMRTGASKKGGAIHIWREINRLLLEGSEGGNE